jgi:predicted DNA-binding transcriptional regulator YafY
MSKTARVYKIELLIRSRGCVSFKELQDELEVSRATLKRDLDYLRDQLQAPIEYDRHSNGWRLVPDRRGGKRHELPGLWFSERELYALLMASRLLGELDTEGIVSRQLQPLLERVHELLGATDGDVKTLMRRVKLISPAKRVVESRFFELMGEALMKRRRIRMTYLTRGRGEVTEREVSPQRLVHYRNTWYLDAWCHQREKVLRFALDAVQQAALQSSRARDVPVKQVEAEMDGGYGAYAGSTPHWVTLSFSPQAAQWVSREEWHPMQRGRWTEEGRYELQVPYTDPTELAMDILRHGGDVTVVEPASLRAMVRKRLQDGLEMNAP